MTLDTKKENSLLEAASREEKIPLERYPTPASRTEAGADNLNDFNTILFIQKMVFSARGLLSCLKIAIRRTL